jgi:hypothetical protein
LCLLSSQVRGPPSCSSLNALIIASTPSA